MKRFVWHSCLNLIICAVLATPLWAAPPSAKPNSAEKPADGDEWPSHNQTGKPAEYAQAREAIDAENYSSAIELLKTALKSAPKDADILNLLGYTHRKTDQLSDALNYYRRALDSDPNHLGAREYLGELYLRQNRLDEAQFQLAQLAKLCPEGCAEHTMLKDAIQTYIENNNAN